MSKIKEHLLTTEDAEFTINEKKEVTVKALKSKKDVTIDKETIAFLNKVIKITEEE